MNLTELVDLLFTPMSPCAYAKLAARASAETQLALIGLRLSWKVLSRARDVSAGSALEYRIISS